MGGEEGCPERCPERGHSAGQRSTRWDAALSTRPVTATAAEPTVPARPSRLRTSERAVQTHQRAVDALQVDFRAPNEGAAAGVHGDIMNSY